MTVTVTEFTDPFCSWCWGVEPILRRVRETFGDQIELRFVMGGLVASFDSFCDSANDITEPEDVAPHWEHAAKRHEMPVDPDIWLTDPPNSSYPACIAYKAAEFQGTAVAHRYLRRLREAIMTERRNIADSDVLVELADDVGLDVEEFQAALDSDRARSAFEEDRAYTRNQDATTFPTFAVDGTDGKRMLAGSQPFEQIATIIEAVGQDIRRESPRPLPAFVEHYAPVATKEVAEVYELTLAEAKRRLADLSESGRVREVPIGSGSLWEV